MDKTPDLLGFLEPDPGSLEDLVTGAVLAELEPSGEYGDDVKIKTEPKGGESRVDAENIGDHLDDGDYFQISGCRIAGSEDLDVTFGIIKSLDSYGDRPPVVQVYFHAPRLHAPDARGITDRVVEFALTLYEALPIEFIHLVVNGPMRPEWMPERDEFGSSVMDGTTFLNILGPSVVAGFDRERLLSAPAYEVDELDDGGVLLRSFEVMEEYQGTKNREIREHLGLQ